MFARSLLAIARSRDASATASSTASATEKEKELKDFADVRFGITTELQGVCVGELLGMMFTFLKLWGWGPCAYPESHKPQFSTSPVTESSPSTHSEPASAENDEVKEGEKCVSDVVEMMGVLNEIRLLSS
jgi:hypothetical protein